MSLKIIEELMEVVSGTKPATSDRRALAVEILKYAVQQERESDEKDAMHECDNLKAVDRMLLQLHIEQLWMSDDCPWWTWRLETQPDGRLIAKQEAKWK